MRGCRSLGFVLGSCFIAMPTRAVFRARVPRVAPPLLCLQCTLASLEPSRVSSCQKVGQLQLTRASQRATRSLLGGCRVFRLPCTAVRLRGGTIIRAPLFIVALLQPHTPLVK